jgi:hypothetical protein
LALIIEGAIEKESQFFKVPDVNLPQNICFNGQKCIFLKTAEKLKEQSVFIFPFFDFFKCSLYLSRAALCDFIFVLHQDELLY